MGHRRFYGLSEAIVILSLLVLAFTLSAQSTTIIDTVFTENSLQGAIGHIMETNMYYAEILPEYASDIGPGDYYVSTGDKSSRFGDKYIVNREMVNGGVRYYLSFLIQDIPRNYVIENVTFMLYQFYCMGDSNDTLFPLFNGIHYGCMVDHINYGNSLEVADFNPLSYGTIGIISNDVSDGWKQLDVTDAYLQNVNGNAQYIQLMIYFPIISDWDDQDDFIWFGSSYFTDTTGFPQIVITYRSLTVTDDNYNVSNPVVSINPNPCHDKVTITTKSPSQLLSAQLYNLKGQLVKIINETNANKNSINLDLDQDLKPGLYLLRYTTRSEGKLNSDTKKLLIH